MYNIIIGAGPAGIFTALELLKQSVEGSHITIFEKGHMMSKRVCPKHKTKKCTNCQPCNITTGFSGAGAFSDGKLSLSPDVGGDFPELVGYKTVEEIIDYIDKIYLEYGADTKLEGVHKEYEIKQIRKEAIAAGLRLVDCPIRHLGTEKAQIIYQKLEDTLLEAGVTIFFDKEVTSLNIEDGKCTGVWVDRELYCADNIIVCTGRRGAAWLEDMCNKYDVKHIPGTVDIGVRVECRNEIMDKINRCLYEGKLVGYPKPFKNKVRTFCQNPGGFVSQENYDNNLAVVNGHSYKDTKSNNTNLSILCSHNFTYPFNEPIKYATMVGQLTNMLADGHILVQRFGDIMDGKRTWQEELDKSNVRPTLPDAVAGDITAAMPYRAMTSIINFIKMVDKVVPGFAADETLLYSPELKFYSNKIMMDRDTLETNIKGLYCLGDSSGWTRGLMMASVMGVYLARSLTSGGNK